MKKFETVDAKKQAKPHINKAIVITWALAFGTLCTAVLTTSCESPTQEKTVVSKTYSATIWGKTITVKDERTNKTTSIDELVSKLQTALTDASDGLDTVIATFPSSTQFYTLANGTKTGMTNALNRGFTIIISDTALTSTEQVKIYDNKTLLINNDFITSADFSWSDKTNLSLSSDDLQTLMISIQHSGEMAINLNTENAIQLASKPAIMAQTGKILAALDIKKINNSAIKIVLI